MRPEELSVGCWVLDTYTDKPMKMDAVNREMGKGLEPIPLTEEILAKNFVKRNSIYGKCFALRKEGADITITEWREFWEVEIATNEKALARLYVLHVHQLQQFLRLAGVNIDIVI